jgi:hypothetical protein
LKAKSYPTQVKPFNFLLSLQAKSRVEMMAANAVVLKNDPLWHNREPHPAAPYNKDIIKAIADAFDRGISEPTHIPASWMKSYARSLARYHLHPEAKFLGGNYDERGILRRRHVQVTAFQQIGKEADNLEEREFKGNSGDDAIEHEFEHKDRAKLRSYILSTQKTLGISDRDICERAHVSHHTIGAVRQNRAIKGATLIGLANAVEKLSKKQSTDRDAQAEALIQLIEMRAALGSDERAAKLLKISRPYATRLINGERPLSKELLAKLLVLKQ